MLDALIESAKAKGASDLHLESGLPPVVRIDGELVARKDPVKAEALLAVARRIIGDADWPLFLEKGSWDLSSYICNVRCRMNIFRTFRGIGMAVRLLSSFQPTVEKLNLHSDLMQIINHSHGLVLVSGPTGSGKTSTLAALIQEINLRRPKHIITIESPIEYHFALRKAFIRQREVGRDTPSFYQGLVDAMREDPDVLMVGEMREPEVMRQTLNAAETGHLVFATVHSGSVTEALQRVVAAFPAEFQHGVRAQLADSLLAVICQRLVLIPQLNLRVPECEILFANLTAKSVIREGKFFKLNDIIQTGAADNMWSFDRYRRWLDARTNWYTGGLSETPPAADASVMQASLNLPPLPAAEYRSKVRKSSAPATELPAKVKKEVSAPAVGRKHPVKEHGEGYFEIGESGTESVEDILKALHTLKKPGK